MKAKKIEKDKLDMIKLMKKNVSKKSMEFLVQLAPKRLYFHLKNNRKK